MKLNFKTKHFAKNFIWLNSTKSTNSFVKKNQNILKNNTVVATLNQTKGYGTKNKNFYSVAFKTLAVSFLFKNILINSLVQISKACAVSLIITLKSFKILNCKIKWFNDILINNKKIAGILCESSIFKKNCNLVVGVGINILATQKELEKFNLKNAASIFSQTNILINPLVFLKKFVEVFERVYFNFVFKNSLSSFLNLNNVFQKNCQSVNANLKLLNTKTNKSFFAVGVKVLLNGNLLIKTKNSLFAIDSSCFSSTILN